MPVVSTPSRDADGDTSVPIHAGRFMGSRRIDALHQAPPEIYRSRVLPACAIFPWLISSTRRRTTAASTLFPAKASSHKTFKKLASVNKQPLDYGLTRDSLLVFANSTTLAAAFATCASLCSGKPETPTAPTVAPAPAAALITAQSARHPVVHHLLLPALIFTTPQRGGHALFSGR